MKTEEQVWGTDYKLYIGAEFRGDSDCEPGWFHFSGRPFLKKEIATGGKYLFPLPTDLVLKQEILVA